MKNALFALCICALAASFAHAQEKIGRKDIDKAIEEYILAHPEVIDRSMKAYYEKMRKSAEDAEFQNAIRDRRTVEVGDSPVLGDKSAPITIVEFSDFQCPYCGRSAAVLSDLRIKYVGRIRLVFKQFPLDTHPAARPAAKASVAAGKQGKFWDYHDLLMANQRDWMLSENLESKFTEYAARLGMNQERFLKDMLDDSADMTVNRDINQGVQLQVNTTPTYFVNGVPLRGAYDLNYFSKVINYLLKEKP